MADTSSFLGLLEKITKIFGLIAGILTMITWFFVVPGTHPKLSVDSGSFTRDVNRDQWRFAVFSFVPSVCVDIWTPFVMGLISILCHINAYESPMFNCRTFMLYFAWNFAQALFGNLGYAGGVGIIAGSVSLFTALFSLICGILDRSQHASLLLDVPQGMSLGRR